METFAAVLPYVLGAAVLATVGVLVVGVVAMFRGGDFNRRHGNRLMRMRVLFQGIAVGVLVLLFILSQLG